MADNTLRVRYIGVEERLSEVGITGKQQVWLRGTSSFVPMADAVLLVSSGKFEPSDSPMYIGVRTASEITAINAAILAGTIAYPVGSTVLNSTVSALWRVSGLGAAGAFASVDGGGNSSPIVAKDEGTTIASSTMSLNFAGAGVVATAAGGDVTVTIPGGGSSLPTAPVQVGGSRPLASTDNGLVLECMATATLTVPAGLPAGFRCVVIPFGTTSVAFTGTTGNGAATTLTRAASGNFAFGITQRGSNVNSYVVDGV
ncbi:hypothetical protein [Rhodoferax sp. WC2427]|uniref:hypothetical protein n=1 Tax=Rhodoferax sp. WC2427 TaxID=3234144 RepID=UPI00346571B9